MKSKLTPAKARRLLQEFSRGAKQLSPRQVRFFELVAAGRKPARLKTNPAATLIYPAIRGLTVQGMKKPGIAGRFRHVFKEPVEVIGLANGDVLLKAKGK